MNIKLIVDKFLYECSKHRICEKDLVFVNINGLRFAYKLFRITSIDDETLGIICNNTAISICYDDIDYINIFDFSINKCLSSLYINKSKGGIDVEFNFNT